MSVFRKLASETAIYGLPTIVGRLVNFFLVPLYTRIFLPEEYGIVSAMFAYASFFNVLFTYGMETTFFRFSSEEPENDKVYSTAYNSIIVSSLFFLFIAIIFKQPIANWMEVGDHPNYFVWFAVIAVFDALVAIPFVKLRQHGKAIRYAVVKSINLAVNIGLNVFFLMLCPYLKSKGWDGVDAIYNPDFGIGYIFVSNLVASIITWPLVYPENLQFNLGFDVNLWKRMMRYAWPLLFVGLAGMVNETIDRILLLKLLPEGVAKHQAGVYAGCYKLSIIMTIFIQAYRMAAEPFLFKEAKTGNPQQTYARLMNYFVIVSCVIFLFVAFFTQFFADTFLQNDKYHEGLHVVPILLLANMFLGIYYNLSIWYKLSNKNIIGSYIAVGAAGITILFNFITIPIFGYDGAAWTTLAAYLFMAIVCYLAGKKHYPIPYQINRIYAYILAMGVFYLIHEIIAKSAGSVAWGGKIFMIVAYMALIYAEIKYDWVKRLTATTK